MIAPQAAAWRIDQHEAPEADSPLIRMGSCSHSRCPTSGPEFSVQVV
jgi:hypothetical protein